MCNILTVWLRLKRGNCFDSVVSAACAISFWDTTLLTFGTYAVLLLNATYKQF